MPYEPSDFMPMMTHLPFVPSTQSRTWSIAALAADAADDSAAGLDDRRAALCPTVGMNALRLHSLSLDELRPPGD